MQPTLMGLGPVWRACLLLATARFGSGKAMAAGEGPELGTTAMLIQVKDAPRGTEMEAFLRRRVQQSGLAPDQGRRFVLAVQYLPSGELALAVHEGDETIAQRQVKAADPTEAKLTAWLFFKSTLGRALRAGPTAPALPEKDQTHAAHPEPPEASQVQPSPQSSAVGVDARPGHGDAAPWTAQAMAAGGVETRGLSSLGVAAGVAIPLGPARVGLELGYRLAAGRAHLRVHHLPVALTFAHTEWGLWRLGKRGTLALSAAVGGDVKIAAAKKRQRTVVGVEAGPWLTAAFPGKARQSALVARLGLMLRPMSQRYVLDNAEVTESAWAMVLGLGVHWQGN